MALSVQGLIDLMRAKVPPEWGDDGGDAGPGCDIRRVAKFLFEDPNLSGMKLGNCRTGTVKRIQVAQLIDRDKPGFWEPFNVCEIHVMRLRMSAGLGHYVVRV